MWSEITKEMFNKLVDAYMAPFAVEEKETYYKAFYKVENVVVAQVISHLAQVTQYYVQDINA